MLSLVLSSPLGPSHTISTAPTQGWGGMKDETPITIPSPTTPHPTTQPHLWCLALGEWWPQEHPLDECGVRVAAEGTKGLGWGAMGGLGHYLEARSPSSLVWVKGDNTLVTIPTMDMPPPHHVCPPHVCPPHVCPHHAAESQQRFGGY